MMKAAASKLKATAKGVLKARDRFWSGVWWTEWRLRRNEQRLAPALEQFGEDSMLVRQLTERHRRLEKGVKYWRLSDPVVVSVLEACERAGASRADLRVLALNRDVFRVRERVQVRRGWLAAIFAWWVLGVTLTSWLMLTIPFVFSPAGWGTKLVGAIAVTSFYWLIWPGLGLYTTRALGAVARAGTAVECIAERHKVRSAFVVSIDSHRHCDVD